MFYSSSVCCAARKLLLKEELYQEACKVADAAEKLAVVAREKANKALEELQAAEEDLKPSPSPAPAPPAPAAPAAPLTMGEEVLMAQEVEETLYTSAVSDTVVLNDSEETQPPKELNVEEPCTTAPVKKKTNWSKGCPPDVPKEVYDEWLSKPMGSKGRFKLDFLKSMEIGKNIGMYKTFAEGKSKRQPKMRKNRAPTPNIQTRNLQPLICSIRDEDEDEDE